MNCYFCSKYIVFGLYMNQILLCNLCRKKIAKITNKNIDYASLDNIDKKIIETLKSINYNQTNLKCPHCKLFILSNGIFKYCINCQTVDLESDILI